MNGHIYALDRESMERLRAIEALDAGALAQLRAALDKDRSQPEARQDSGGSIMVIPVFGMIEQRTSLYGMLFGGTSTQRISASLKMAMRDPAVTAVILEFQSGGGSVSGVTELAAEIRAARSQQKPIVSMVNSMAASAAYWLAAQAHEVVITPSGTAGSIGVYGMHVDTTKADEMAGVVRKVISAGKNKAAEAPGAPLTDESEAALQALVDSAYGMFVADVAEGRGVDVAKVEADFGQGVMFAAKSAKAVGLVDRVATFDDTVRRLSTPQGRSAITRAEVTEPVGESGEAEIRRRRMAVSRTF